MKKKNKDEFSLMNLFKFVVIVIVAFAAFYGITILVTNKKADEKQKIEASIQYDEILVGQILNNKDESYYVLVENEDNENNINYYQYISKKNNLKVYYCDLSNAFNKKFKSDDSNLYVDSIDQIKFADTVLLYVEKGKIVSAYETDEEITNTLESNLKENSK